MRVEVHLLNSFLQFEIRKLVLITLIVSVAILITTITIAILTEQFAIEEKEKIDKPDKPDIPQLTSEKSDLKVVVYKHNQGEMLEMDLEEYLVGVVISEMPPKFDMEALRAQSVTARTYTLSRLKKKGGPGCDLNSQADVCTNPDYCQAYYSPEQVKEIYPDRSTDYYKKVTQAVTDTRGEVLTYQGEPLSEAPYHSTCGGKTETAEAVWSSDLPFLESIDCSYCQHSDYYFKEQELTKNQLEQGFQESDLSMPVIAEGELPELNIINESDTGRVKEADLAGNRVSGQELRNIFEIPSTKMEWEAESDKINLITEGFGHGVGLCQYGADGKAKEGYNYKEILDFYFNNTKVDKY